MEYILVPVPGAYFEQKVHLGTYVLEATYMVPVLVSVRTRTFGCTIKKSLVKIEI